MALSIETELLEDRLARLGLRPSSEKRAESLALAHERGVSDTALAALAAAERLSQRQTVWLPAHHYESLSRGRGWCRQGRGDSAQWGEREDGGYRVGPGKWVVGATDGFSRRAEQRWIVRHVTVGEKTWTVAGAAS